MLATFRQAARPEVREALINSNGSLHYPLTFGEQEAQTPLDPENPGCWLAEGASLHFQGRELPHLAAGLG